MPNKKDLVGEKAIEFINKYITFGFLGDEHETDDGLIISPLYFDSHIELEDFYKEFKSFIYSLLTAKDQEIKEAKRDVVEKILHIVKVHNNPDGLEHCERCQIEKFLQTLKD